MTATAVLLPVRIETVLDPPTNEHNQWVLRFRLIPDVVSIVPVDSGSTEQGPNAKATREWASAVAGFPNTILVCVERAGLPPEKATLHVDLASLTLPSDEADLADASSDQWDPAASFVDHASPGPWWLSYSGAIAVGLGGAIQLGPDHGEITVVYAVGVGSDPAHSVLSAHAHAKRLSRIAAGSPTNTVSGDDAANRVLVDELNASGVLDAEPDERRRLLTTALWSALFGDALVEVFGAPRDRVDAIAEWSADWLAPGGTRSAVAIRDVPYGVFATTDLSRLEPLSGDPRSTEVATIVTGLVDALAARAEQRTYAASPVDALVERLGQQASSGRFRLRAAQDVLGQPADAAYSAALESLLPLGVVPSVVHPLPDKGSEPYPRAVFAGDDEERQYLARMQIALASTLETFPMITPPEELPSPERTAGLFVKVLDRSIRAEVATNTDAAVGRLKRVLELLESVVDTGVTDGIESGTRGLVDAAGQRIDPWAVAIAEQRWAAAGGGSASPLGLYGWVDGPIEPADLRGTFTLAPSITQATVAAIALDRHLTDGDPDSDRWRMALDSASIRTAEELGGELRAGTHLSQAIARKVERYAPEELRQQLRTTFPRGLGGPGGPALDGVRMLDAWRVAGALGLGDLPQALTDELDRLTAGVDAYADLLVIDALQHVVDGRPDLAKANLDAAAGITTPASFGVLRTPHTASDARTIVLAAVPFVARSRSPATAYAAADPSMSAYLNGVADPRDFAYEITLSDGEVKQVTLAELGVDLATAAVLPPMVLERAVRLLWRPGEGGQVREPAKMALVRRRARAMTGRLPDETSSELTNVDDPGELLARLHTVLELARSIVDDMPEPAEAPTANRRLLLGFGLASGTDDEYRAAVAELAVRSREAFAIAGKPDAPISLIAGALRSMLGGSEATMPISRGASLPSRADATDETLRDWLGTISALRSRVADLDVELLAGADVQLASSSAEPWGRDGDPRRPLFVTFGPTKFLDSRAAVSVVDSFAESLPVREHDAGMAFHFDAPTARAPQAILLAVPGDPRVEELSPQDALSIVKATRSLAHARMFQLRDDPILAAVAPTALFPHSELNGRLP